MSTVAPSSGSSPLPAGVASILESFRRLHDGARVRIWAVEGADWRQLFPGESTGADGPDTAAARQSIELRDGPRLELEIEGGDVRGADVEFLATTLGQVLEYERETRSAAHELAERYEEINLLYLISEILGSVLSLEAASSRILAEVADVMAARRASLWVYRSGDERLHLTAAVGEEGLTGPIPTGNRRSVTAWVFRERQALNLERDGELPPGVHMDLRPRRKEAFLSVPINYTSPEGVSRTVGVITLVGRRTDVRFSAGDARLLTAIASQVGAAVEIHRLVRESLEQERLVRELELAHDLQLKLLPETTHFEGAADVAARCVPADSVGGDFYHLFRLSGDRLGVVIGDVSSHGFSAALIMAMTMSAVAIYASETGPPAKTLRRVHRALIGELEATEMYMSIFYGVVDRARGELVYANAGHPHAFCVRADGSVDRLGATNPPLGTAPLEAYGEASTAWAAGRDLLCLFTDGLSDVVADGLRAGERRLLREVVRQRERPSPDILEKLFAMTEREVEPAVPPDDRTAVLLRA